MLFKEMMEDERYAGRIEGISEGRLQGVASSILAILASTGKVSASSKEFIANQKDEDILNQWLLIAASASSVEEFEQKIRK